MVCLAHCRQELQQVVKNCKTFSSRPRPRPRPKCSRPRPRSRLSFLSSRRLETKTLVSRTTSLVNMVLLASGNVTLELISTKCMPALLYGLEACPLCKTDVGLLDFVVSRFVMKLQHIHCKLLYTI